MKVTYNNFRKYHKVFLNKIGKSIVIALLEFTILLNPFNTRAQVDGVTINVKQLDIAANLWHLEDLLNMITIEYNGDKNIDICLEATIRNIEDSSGSIYLKGEGYDLFPNSLPQYLVRGNFKSVNVTGDDDKYTEDVKDIALRTGSLPAGTYSICIEQCNNNSINNCVEQKIFYPTPPELTYPLNNSDITEDLPVFSWLPPMPTYGNEKYSLQIVEINDGQSPIEAMEANSPWFYAENIEYNSHQLSIAEREFVSGQSYAWKVSATVGLTLGNGNPAVVVSPVWSFKFNRISDSLPVLLNPNFYAACKILKDSVDINEEAKIYGVINPIPEGATIESEVYSDFERLKIENEPYLFIIDDEPGKRFGHPVQWVLVNEKSNIVKKYNANWFPLIRHSIERFEDAGDATIEEIEMKLLRLNKQAERTTKKTVERKIGKGNEIEKEIKKKDCGKMLLIIDGGEYESTGTITERVREGARKADSLVKEYGKKGFDIRRFSQLKTNKSTKVKSLQVDQKKNLAKEEIMYQINDIKAAFIRNECCNTQANLEPELGIYIWANAIPDSTKFMIYDPNIDFAPDGKIAYEAIDYKDILKYLSILPPCVKLTLFYVNDCFTGKTPIVEQRLKSDIEMLKNKRKGFKIISDL